MHLPKRHRNSFKILLGFSFYYEAANILKISCLRAQKELFKRPDVHGGERTLYLI